METVFLAPHNQDLHCANIIMIYTVQIDLDYALISTNHIRKQNRMFAEM